MRSVDVMACLGEKIKAYRILAEKSLGEETAWKT
jgi:hypothetical protein